MIAVRDVFRTRFGKVEELLALFAKERIAGPLFGMETLRVTSELISPLFAAASEYYFESIDEFYAQAREWWKQVEFKVWFNQMINCVESGTREFYTLELPPANLQGERGGIMVRNVYQTRYGRAEAMVAHLHREVEVAAKYRVPPLAIYTDLSGPMFTVISARDYPNLAAYEKGMETIATTPEYNEWRRGLMALVETGHREIWRIE